MASFLQEIYKSKIDFSIKSHQDNGFTVSLGCPPCADTIVNTFEEAEGWLRHAVLEFYPNSAFSDEHWAVLALWRCFSE